MTECHSQAVPALRVNRRRDRGAARTEPSKSSERRARTGKGHYWVYETLPDGSEVRRHKAVVIGPKANMTRQQAKDALRQIIVRTSDLKRPEATKPMTFGQFWRERFLPMCQGKWKVSSRQTQIDNIERYCVELLESIPLVEIETFQLQMITNRLAQRYSKSVVSKFLIWRNESTIDGQIYPTLKTKDSKGFVALPSSYVQRWMSGGLSRTPPQSWALFSRMRTAAYIASTIIEQTS